jgi:hypothetical protein
MEVAEAAPEAKPRKAHGRVADIARKERRENGREGMGESYLFLLCLCSVEGKRS